MSGRQCRRAEQDCLYPLDELRTWSNPSADDRRAAKRQNSRARLCDPRDVVEMVTPTGFEPVAYGLGIRCSIRLSYGADQDV